MNREQYKSVRKSPKRNSPISRSKTRMLAMIKEIKPITSPKLCQIYSTRTEWVTKRMPKVKEQ